MSSVDDRVVQMEFDNAQFQQRMANTLKSLDDLSSSIQLLGAKQGFTEVASAANKFDPSGMASAIQNISSKFSAMGAIGFSVIQDLTQHVLGFVGHMASIAETDVLGPIITGGKTRAGNIEQAKFQFAGLGIDVDKAMASALKAVQGTAYGLDEAAKVAAQFGASGIQAGDQMTSALRGISGAAAMTGASFSEIGQIYTGIAGAGKVNNQDFMQFATRGLNAAAAVAKQTGKTEEQIHQMATDGKLDFATFADAMDKAFGEHATQANETYAGSLSNLHAAMSRLGASFFGPEQTQQRDLFNALTPVVDKLTATLQPLFAVLLSIRQDAVTGLIAKLKELDFSNMVTAIHDVVQGVKNVVSGIVGFADAVKEAWREIFPAQSQFMLLAQLASVFLYLSEKIKEGGENAEKWKRSFAGVFAIVDILRAILVQLFYVIVDVFQQFSGTGSGLLDFTANTGDALVRLDAALVKGRGLIDFFAKVKVIINTAIEDVKHIETTVQHFFDSFQGAEAPALESVDRVSQRFDSLRTLLDRLEDFGSGVRKVLAVIWGYLSDWFSQLGHNIAAVLKPGDFNSALDVVNIGLMGGIIVAIRNFLKDGLKVDLGARGGIFGTIQASLRNLTSTMKAMQAELKAKLLLEIAGAIAIITISLVALSLIDSDKLTKALTAMAIGFAQLVGVMKLLDQMASTASEAGKLVLLGIAMSAVAGAMVILSTAVRILAGLSWEELAKGLGGVTAMLTIMTTAAMVMSGNIEGMIGAGIAMAAMATGLVILAGAVKAFGSMSWTELAKGLGSVAVALGVIAVAMMLMPVASTLAAGLAMIPLATGLVILAGAVKIFATMSWGEMLKGMVGLAGSLTIIALAMQAMPLSLPITAAGLVLVGVALNIMAVGVRLMGSMDMATLAKGLLGIAALMVILVAAMAGMEGALPGAAALLVVSVALGVLSEVLEKLGKISWGDLVKGLVAIAAVLVVLGLAALVLDPLIPAMLGLGAAMILLGAGFALFGAGAFLVGHAFEAMAAAGVAGTKAMIESIKLLLGALPDFIASLGVSILAGAGELLKSADLVLRVLGVFLLQILETIVQLSPQIAAALVAIISNGLLLMRTEFPAVAETAYAMLIVFLTATREHLPEVEQLAIDIVVAFANKLTDNADKLVDAAVDLLVAFLKAISDRAGDVAGAGLDMLVHFIAGIIEHEGQAIDAGAELLLKIIEGLGRDIIKIDDKAADIAIEFVQGMGKNALKFANAAADALISFLNGLAEAIRVHTPELQQAGINVASAIVDGMTGGILAKAGDVAGAAVSLARRAIDDVKGFLHMNSPSKVTEEIGMNMALGVAAGLDNDTTAQNSAVVAAQKIVDAFSVTLSKIPDSLEGLDANPVITPVLDLTKVQSAANGLNDMFPTPSITPDVSLSQARTIATTAEIVNPVPTVAPSTTELHFEQNIYSPDALSTNDVYRGTKSQLALAKEELNI